MQFGIAAGIDMVALSFVRTPGDVRLLRSELKGANIPIVAKIEKPAAWDNIEPILDEADGVMVARGDLGVEMALEKVPRIQKSIIRRARRKRRFVITATQMLESMVEHPTPTRAEVSDVANAIYDGTDAVMLSAETSVGKYPVEAVQFMARIAAETESSISKHGYQEPQTGPHPGNAEILADAAYRAAREARVAAIVVFTASGSTPAWFRATARRFPSTPSRRMKRRPGSWRLITASPRSWRPTSARPMKCSTRWTFSWWSTAVEARRAGSLRGRSASRTRGHHESDEAAPDRRVRKNNVISNVKSQMSRLRRAQSALTPGL